MCVYRYIMVCNIQNSSCFSSVCAARTCACYVLQGAGHAERWGKNIQRLSEVARKVTRRVSALAGSLTRKFFR